MSPLVVCACSLLQVINKISYCFLDDSVFRRKHRKDLPKLACPAQCKDKGDKRTPNDDDNFEKMEEINFHKIAMRYSNSLVLLNSVLQFFVP